jgi:hypothetical protein
MGNVRDKATINMINLLIEKGATSNDIFKVFDRNDVSYNSNRNLVEKYHKLYSSGKINVKGLEENNLKKLQNNDVSKNVFEFLNVKLNN